jgi:hypothetical protein
MSTPVDPGHFAEFKDEQILNEAILSANVLEGTRSISLSSISFMPTISRRALKGAPPSAERQQCGPE